MKMKKLIIGTAAAMFAVVSTQAQESDTTVTIPPGRTVVEVAPGAEAEITTDAPRVEVSDETTLIQEPAGAYRTSEAPAWGDRFRYDDDAAGDELYPDQEFTIDLFAAYADQKEKFNDTFDESLRGGRFGAGLGVNYFFTRNLGIGADAFGIDNNDGDDIVDAANASLIFRLPIDVAHLAPYAFGGGGRQWEGRDTWTAHVGAGLEVRLNRHTGIFLDGRHVFTDEGGDYALIRSGLRFAF